MNSPAALFDPPFEIRRPPVHSAPLVFNSPHSGRIYPEPFLETSALDALSLRKSEDCYVEQLFDSAVSLGAPLMYAHFPRAYIDLNREPYELDQRMFSDRLPDFVNTRSMRAAGGLGTVARIVAETSEIYRRKLRFEEAHQRIRQLYMPYHDQLRELLRATLMRFGAFVMIDCHSMPSLQGARSRSNSRRPDFVLGDRYGTACASAVTDLVEAILRRLGYTVARNKPYAGGYITHAYGKPGSGANVLQIEINRGLYMNEDNLEKHDGFRNLKNDLSTLISELAEQVPAIVGPFSAAAE